MVLLECLFKLYAGFGFSAREGSTPGFGEDWKMRAYIVTMTRLRIGKDKGRGMGMALWFDDWVLHVCNVMYTKDDSMPLVTANG